jgi:hypothetical protein
LARAVVIFYSSSLLHLHYSTRFHVCQ